MRKICVLLCLTGLILGMAACGRTVKMTKEQEAESYVKEQESVEEEQQKDEIKHKADNGKIQFQCEAIEAAVREQLELGSEVVIREQMLEEMDVLSISIENGDGPAYIADDLQYFPDLKVLNIFVDMECEEEMILDYDKLGTDGQLEKLEELYIRDCYLEDISFVIQLDSLKKLFIPESNVSDISILSYMKNLTHLSLYGTPVWDIKPLGELTDLVELSLSNCDQIKNIEVIASMTKMENLGLINCGIDDISFLKDMKNLRYLNLNGNEIEDISLLAQFTQLSGLSLESNKITDVNALTGLENLTVASVYDNPIKNLGSLVGVVPSFDAAAANDAGTKEWQDEVDRALQVYDVTAVEKEGHLLEVEDYYVGDATGDGIDDVGVVASWTDEENYHIRRDRWLYVYPGSGSSYQKPLEPMEMRDGTTGGIQGDPYHGIILQDGKLIIQYQGGSNFSWRNTHVYKVKDQIWECVMNTELDWWSGSIGYDYKVTDYENNVFYSYILCTDELYQWHKLKISEGTTDSRNQDKIPDAWESYYRYQYHYEMAELPYSAQDALEMVMNESVSRYDHKYEAKKVYITNDEGLTSCEKLFGYELPDYYYTMETPDGYMEIYYYDNTAKDDSEEEKHVIRVNLDGEPYELYAVEVQSGRMELAETYIDE